MIIPASLNREIIKCRVFIKSYMDPAMAAFEWIDERQQDHLRIGDKKMLHHDTDTYWLSRQQDMLPSTRFDGLVNSISVTDRSEGRRLIAQISHAAARVGATMGSAFVGVGNKIAKTFSMRRPSTP